MDPASNEIRATLPAPIKSLIPSMNLTKFQEAIVTTEQNPVQKHFAVSEFRDVHDIYSRLGYGHCT